MSYMFYDDINHPEKFANEEALAENLAPDDVESGVYFTHQVFVSNGCDDKLFDNLVMFLEIPHGAKDKSPTAYKVHYNGTLGEFVEQETLYELPKGDPRFTTYYSIEKHVAHMSYAGGQTVMEIVEQTEPWTISERLQGIRAMCQTMIDLHQQGFVHGDLNDENVKLEKLPSGEIRVNLIDFEQAQKIKDSWMLEYTLLNKDYEKIFYCIADMVFWRDVFNNKGKDSFNFMYDLKEAVPSMDSKNDIELICHLAEKKMLELAQ